MKYLPKEYYTVFGLLWKLFSQPSIFHFPFSIFHFPFTFYLFLFFFYLLPFSINSQDIHFSQYFSSPLILNPGLTGQFDGDYRLISNYKNQWGSVSDFPFETISVSTDKPFFKNKLAAGLLFYKDKAGDSKMGISQISFSLASRVAFDDKNSIATGIQSGWVQRSVDVSNLTWDMQYDGKIFNKSLFSGENTAPANFNYFDLSAGTYYKGIVSDLLSFNAGIAAFHLNMPKHSYFGSGDRLHVKWTFHGGAAIGFKNWNKTLLPTFMILKQGGASEINIGAAMKYNLGMDSKYTGINVSSNIIFGGYYRVKDAVIAYTRYDFKDIFSIGFSYDINLSKLRVASYARGGAEVFLSFTIRRSNVTVQTGDKIKE